MLTGDAYSSEHLVPSRFGLQYALLVETNPFLELVMFSGLFTLNILRYFLDFALFRKRASAGDIDLLLHQVIHMEFMDIGITKHVNKLFGARCDINHLNNVFTSPSQGSEMVNDMFLL